jgi:hypothetical protein
LILKEILRIAGEKGKRLTSSETKMLGKIFLPKGGYVRGKWRQLLKNVLEVDL